MANQIGGGSLARKRLDRQFADTEIGRMARPPKGWLRAIRDALGLTTRQLAARMGKNHSTILALEKGEVAGTASLNTLREAAAALNCTLVYAIIPNDSLEAMARGQARKAAEERLGLIDHTMRLEHQAIRRADLAEQVDQLAEDLLRTGGSTIWDKP